MKYTKLEIEAVLACVTVSNKLEGLEPSEHSNMIINRYISGEITGDEAIEEIKKHYKNHSLEW